MRFIGDGDMVDTFRAIAESLQIADRIEWVGRIKNYAELQKEYRNADIMIFPTMAEGLPRVILEAMSNGMPCITSNVCGIPELLDENMMVKNNDIDEYISIINKLIDNPSLLEEQSEKNIKKAREYMEETLNTRRKLFYTQLRELCNE